MQLLQGCLPACCHTLLVLTNMKCCLTPSGQHGITTKHLSHHAHLGWQVVSMRLLIMKEDNAVSLKAAHTRTRQSATILHSAAATWQTDVGLFNMPVVNFQQLVQAASILHRSFQSCRRYAQVIAANQHSLSSPRLPGHCSILL